MARIIRDFAGSSRIDQTELRDDVNVNEQLDLALRVVGLTHEVAGLQVRRHYQPVPAIRAVPGEIGQVFVSVITNAIQAMKGKGAIDLCTEASAGAVSVTIRDQGPGVPVAHASRIFDPFFTTKAPGQGTGLGLTLARRILLRCGGQIRLDRSGGPGAAMVMTFPVPHPDGEDAEVHATHIRLSPPVSTPVSLAGDPSHGASRPPKSQGRSIRVIDGSGLADYPSPRRTGEAHAEPDRTSLSGRPYREGPDRRFFPG
jgi:hypothetical protein